LLLLLLLLVSVFDDDAVCVGIARVGSDTQTIRSGTLQQLTSVDLGGPLHSFIVTGHMHPLETDYLKQFSFVESTTFKNTSKTTDSGDHS